VCDHCFHIYTNSQVPLKIRSKPFPKQYNYLASVRLDVRILVDVEVLLFVGDFLALFGRVLSGELAILEIIIISNIEKLFRTFENEMSIVDF